MVGPEGCPCEDEEVAPAEQEEVQDGAHLLAGRAVAAGVVLRAVAAQEVRVVFLADVVRQAALAGPVREGDGAPQDGRGAAIGPPVVALDLMWDGHGGGGCVGLRLAGRAGRAVVLGGFGWVAASPKPLPGMRWKGGRYPHPLQGAQPMPSHCPPDGKGQLQWHL